MASKIALITGVTGQDGAYLARFLLEKGYDVYGSIRRSSSPNTWRLETLGIRNDVRPVTIDLAEYSNIRRVVEQVRPDEVYNLAAPSSSATSFDQPIYTADIIGTAAARLLEILRDVQPAARFYQASTSEMFGKVRQSPQTESTPFHPRSPYGVAKLYAHWIAVNYRETYGIHASTGIMFNHESPLRGIEFVTRKITTSLAEIRLGRRSTLLLGNLDAKRDWGFAGDFVKGMWQILQHSSPDDFVLATGDTHTVRQFVQWAAEAAGFSLRWEGQGDQERGIEVTSGKEVVRVDPRFYRPVEVDLLVGDASKARDVLGWMPSLSVQELATQMVEADLRRATQGPVLV